MLFVVVVATVFHLLLHNTVLFFLLHNCLITQDFTINLYVKINIKFYTFSVSLTVELGQDGVKNPEVDVVVLFFCLLV